MDKQLELRLLKEFPKLFAELKRSGSLLSWGICTGDGWFSLIYDLSRQIQQIVESTGMPYFYFVQVKEKFGQLRVHYRTGLEDEYGEIVEDPQFEPARQKILELVINACNESAIVCEECGNPGSLIREGWYRVCCDKCEAKSERHE